MGRAKRLRQQVHTDGTNGMSAKTLRLTWIAAAMLAASPAMGLQPLEALIAAAREQNPDAQRARANLAEQNAQADVSPGRHFPGYRSRQATCAGAGIGRYADLAVASDSDLFDPIWAHAVPITDFAQQEPDEDQPPSRRMASFHFTVTNQGEVQTGVALRTRERNAD